MTEETQVRSYEPPEEFAAQANVNDASIYEEAEKDYEGFWAERARELHWFKEWDQVLDWDPPEAQWFVGGKTNASYNCLDYQVEQGRGDKTAILWEGDEPGDTRTYTYSELTTEVRKFANVLKGLGVGKGDPVADLPAHDPRAAHRDAGLRPHRGPALGGLRRLLRRRSARPHKRLRGEGARDGRRRAQGAAR